MAHSLSSLALIAAGLVPVALGCSEILGVQDIPKTSPDAGADARTTDAKADVVDAARHDARDAVSEARGDAREGGRDGSGDGATEGSVDAPIDSFIACGPVGTTICADDGLRTLKCTAKGTWQPDTACSGETPVCISGACHCTPQSTRCNGQLHERCVDTLDAGLQFQAGDAAPCPGTCTLTGCGAVPPSCLLPDAGVDAGLDAAIDASLPGLTGCPDLDGGGENCCTSNEVPGGTFYVSYDGISGNFKTKEGQATLTGFRLDRFEVTVGRFRQFYRFLQERADAGWAPPVGSGKHTHLNGGQGLVDRAVDGGAAFESGWQSGWDDEVTSAAIRTSFKTCLGATWTDADSSADDRPINCVTWAQAYAFCIWDGGFLPAEAEWNYASAGGSEQRLYPWSPSLSAQQAMWSPDAGYDQNVDCSQANFLYGQQCNPGGAQGVGLTSHVDGGDSRWLQADMAGNVFEWTLDYYPSDYFTHWQCRDCAVLSVADGGPQIRVQRGGAYLSQNYTLVAAYRGSSPVDIPTGEGGFRCAREP